MFFRCRCRRQSRAKDNSSGVENGNNIDKSTAHAYCFNGLKPFWSLNNSCMVLAVRYYFLRQFQVYVFLLYFILERNDFLMSVTPMCLAIAFFLIACTQSEICFVVEMPFREKPLFELIVHARHILLSQHCLFARLPLYFVKRNRLKIFYVGTH